MVRLLTIALTSVIAMFLGAQMMLSGQPGTADPVAAPAAPAEPEPRGAYYTEGRGRTVLRRDAGGQFHIDAQVNGQDGRFLIDTGADVVALTVADAEAMNIDFSSAHFEEVARTASGAGMGQQVMIDRLEVGGMEFNNVPAIVVEGLDVNLLGQSVLRRMGKVELSGDRMVIHKS